MSGIYLPSCRLLQRVSVTSGTALCAAHRACPLDSGWLCFSLLRFLFFIVVLWCCYPQDYWGSLAANGMHFSLTLSHRLSLWCHTSTSFHDLLSLAPKLQMRPLRLYQWPLLVSLSTKAQLLSMIPSCLQNQYYLGDSYILPNPDARTGYFSSFSLLSENTYKKISTQ